MTSAAVLRPGGAFVYTVRHTGDADHDSGIPHGDGVHQGDPRSGAVSTFRWTASSCTEDTFIPLAQGEQLDAALRQVGARVDFRPAGSFRSSDRWLRSVPLTDAQWARIEPLLPDRAPTRGGRWRDHRQMIDAIAFKYGTGTPLMDLPERFGSWKDADNRLRKWAADGTWEKVFTALLAQADAEGDLGRRPRLGRCGRLHDRLCPPARRRSPPKGAPAGGPHDNALGRSRGGLTTRIHLAAARSPSSSHLAGWRRTSVHPGHGTVKGAPADRLPQDQAGRGPGRHAYSSRAIRRHLRWRGI